MCGVDDGKATVEQRPRAVPEPRAPLAGASGAAGAALLDALSEGVRRGRLGSGEAKPAMPHIRQAYPAAR